MGDHDHFADYDDVENGNFSGNMTNCTNDYCISDQEYWDLILQHITPQPYEWALIFMHFVVFVVGLVGNALVCIVVYRVSAMRTVTNYFIVNLALADFLVILFCQPTTVVWDTTETWMLGTVPCKLIVYFQTVSVAVSVLTLTFISLDRWYAICFPLKFNSTTARAKTAIIIIWIVALLCDIPELITLRTTQRHLNIETIVFTQCMPAWSDTTERHYQVIKSVVLYFLPLGVTSIAYLQIVRVLWRSGNIPGHVECRAPLNTISGCRRMTIANTSTEGQLKSRRKAAKMLVAVVIMFAVCYFPVHLVAMLRYTIEIRKSDMTEFLATFSHWLCYANSAVNPVIYNFMSGKFRKEFRRTFSCFGGRSPRRNNLHMSSYASRYAVTNRTELMPLSMTSHLEVD
ncbi:hypothetical protein GE061_009880 [Apolygus lucorum]|uniref:G-protein coupled receptors family 1 profile domain-containing protein n=1 Tax=Apolygus lucorum TaxID=248454 RepID=A0A6A4KHA7_APOLU|nr:hypothetical protein GE061_009880 [Apolygus lucorum]